jgi:hypothetical protein
LKGKDPREPWYRRPIPAQPILLSEKEVEFYPLNRIYIPHLPETVASIEVKRSLNKLLPGCVDEKCRSSVLKGSWTMVRLSGEVARVLVEEKKILKIEPPTGDRVRSNDSSEFRILPFGYKSKVFEGKEITQKTNKILIRRLIPGWSSEDLKKSLEQGFGQLKLEGKFRYLRPPPDFSISDREYISFEKVTDVDKVIERFGWKVVNWVKGTGIAFEGMELWIDRWIGDDKFQKSTST